MTGFIVVVALVMKLNQAKAQSYNHPFRDESKAQRSRLALTGR
jgi:hypothetical protein